MELEQLEAFLRREGADFALIRQAAPIRTREDAARYFPAEQAAAALVVQTGPGLAVLYAGAGRGRLDFAALRRELGLPKLKLADRRTVAAQTGYEPGAVPLVGLGLPCFLDRALLGCSFVYGGSGDPLVTLKLSVRDLERLNRVEGYF